MSLSGAAVYILGALTSFACALLLWRAYVAARNGLVFWSSLCFFGLSLSNAFLFIDLVLLPDTDLHVLRLLTAAVSLLLLVYGLVWERD
jgi:hypothetical protein